MKIFSEVTKNFYNTVEECQKAEDKALAVKAEKEKQAKALSETRAVRSKEIEEAMKIANEASEKVKKLVNDFVRDYGCYHSTIRQPYSGFFWDSFFSDFLNKF